MALRNSASKTDATKFRGYKSTKGLLHFSDFIAGNHLITRFVRSSKKEHFLAEEVRTLFLDLGNGCFALISSSIVYPCCCKAAEKSSSDARETLFTSGDWIKGSREFKPVAQSGSQNCQSKAQDALRLFADPDERPSPPTLQATVVSPSVWDGSKRQKARKQPNDTIVDTYLGLIKPALDVAINSNSILRDEVVDSLTALSRRKPVINLHEEQSLSKELWKLSNQKQKTSGILIYILRLIASNYSLYDWNINGKTDLVYRSIKYRWMILAEFANTLVNGLLPHVGRNALILYTALAATGSKFTSIIDVSNDDRAYISKRITAGLIDALGTKQLPDTAFVVIPPVIVSWSKPSCSFEKACKTIGLGRLATLCLRPQFSIEIPVSCIASQQTFRAQIEASSTSNDPSSENETQPGAATMANQADPRHASGEANLVMSRDDTSPGASELHSNTGASLNSPITSGANATEFSSQAPSFEPHQVPVFQPINTHNQPQCYAEETNSSSDDTLPSNHNGTDSTVERQHGDHGDSGSSKRQKTRHETTADRCDGSNPLVHLNHLAPCLSSTPQVTAVTIALETSAQQPLTLSEDRMQPSQNSFPRQDQLPGIHDLLVSGPSLQETNMEQTYMRHNHQHRMGMQPTEASEQVAAIVPRTPYSLADDREPNFHTLVPTGPSNTVDGSSSARSPHATPIRVVSPVRPLLSPPSNIMRGSTWEFDSQFDMEMRTLEHVTRCLSPMAEFGISSYSADCEEY